MPKQSALWALVFSVPLLSLSCSSDDGEDGSGGPGTAGTGAKAGGGIILGGNGPGAGSGGASGSGGKVYDGGSVELTPEEYDAIRSDQCAGWESEGEELSSVIQLVIDVSSSMNEPAPGNRGQTKWDVTRDALLEAIVGINGPGLPGSVAVGLLFYPNLEATINRRPGDVTDCVNTGAMVEPALLGGPGAAHRMMLGEAIRNVELQTSTPTHDAFSYALDNGLLPSRLPGERFMLLITDGAPTLARGCYSETGDLTNVNPQPIVDEVTRAADEGVRTFLIGSPGSERNRTWMSTAAVIGGTAPAGCNVNGPDYCHMDMTEAPDFSAALRAGLARVAGAVAPCRYTFAEPPPGMTIDPKKINVVLNSSQGQVLIVRDDVGDCSEGWQLTSNREIQLCPDTCDRVQSEAGMVVDVVFGCESLITPPR